MLKFLVLAICLAVLATADSPPAINTVQCRAVSGVCKADATCAAEKGSPVSGKCPGLPANVRCCIPAAATPKSNPSPTPTSAPSSPTTAPSSSADPCANRGGKCSTGCTTASGGVWIRGLCPGKYVCCVGGGTQPVPGKSSATFYLQNQAFSNVYPGALVYIPSSFDMNGPLNIVNFIHGFGNCVENAARPTKKPAGCTPGKGVGYSFGLIDQIEAANAQAILILPEVMYDQASAAPGKLGETNGYRNFLAELLGELAPTLGPRTVSSINSIQTFSFSGAYYVTALMATIGGVPQLREIVMLDSLYGSVDTYTNWIQKNVDSKGPNPQFKYANVYGDSTNLKSKQLAQTIKTFWTSKGRSTTDFVWDDTTATLGLPFYTHPLVFKKTTLPHNTIPSVFVQPFVAASFGKPKSAAAEVEIEDSANATSVDEDHDLDFIDKEFDLAFE